MNAISLRSLRPRLRSLLPLIVVWCVDWFAAPRLVHRLIKWYVIFICGWLIGQAIGVIICLRTGGCRVL